MSGICLRTPGDVDEVFARSLVDLYVALAQMVFVFFQGQVSVLLGLEADQGLAIPPALLAETKSHAPSANTNTYIQSDIYK